MTEEAKRTVEILHERGCRGCLVKEISACVRREEGKYCMNFYHEAADLIDSLSAQLEQVTRERDAAIRDIEKSPITLCNVCAHYHKNFPCSGGNGTDKINITIACTMFKWRGVEVEG